MIPLEAQEVFKTRQLQTASEDFVLERVSSNVVMTMYVMCAFMVFIVKTCT